MVNRVVSGAHYGVRDWLVQRFSALLMALYSLVLVAMLVAHQPLTYAGWRTIFGTEWVRYATLLFAISLYAHTWIGMRNIFMDYVHATWLRLSLQFLTVVTLFVYAAWTVRILWRFD
jgi:succinate dehydrogenase / fumarate reductase membrane anchor subunit